MIPLHRLMLPLAVLLLSGPAARAQVPAAGQDSVARVDTLFTEWNSTATPGCAVAVARHGRPIIARAYGTADLEHGVPNSPETVMEAGSVSKQFTAAAVALLAQQGRISLDDEVRTYLSELPDYGASLTIRHMLNHTSGLRDWGSLAGIHGWPRGRRAHTHAHVLEILSRQRALNFPPGSEYSYSNSGYNLAVMLVERITGESLNTFMKRHFFDPLGMAHTQWRDDFTRIVPGRATAYSRGGDGFRIAMPFENVYGNGGLLTTVGDLLIWMRSLDDGRVGGAALVEELHRRGRLNDGSEIAYALGLRHGELSGIREVAHTGSTGGYRAFAGRYPEHGLAVALLCNIGAVNPGAVGRRIAQVFLPPSPRLAASPAAAGPPGGNSGQRPPFTPGPGTLADFVGEYYSDEIETTFRIVLEDSGLVLLRGPADRIPLQPQRPDGFTSRLGQVSFIRDDAGRVTALSVRQARVHDLRFPRVASAGGGS